MQVMLLEGIKNLDTSARSPALYQLSYNGSLTKTKVSIKSHNEVSRILHRISIGLIAINI
jgi:hypothetical protein